MIRRIYTTIISFTFAVLTLTSCSDWLELYPADEIKEEYLFSSGDGYRTALNGIYRKMATFNLYGSNLTWGIIDAWGQAYYLDEAPDSGGGKAMDKISDFNFKNAELVPTTDAMWNAAWNVVANCNNLAPKKIIDVNKSKRYFRASTSRYDIEEYGNMKMYNDIIFALYSPTELVDWDHEINHAYDGSDGEKYLCIHKNIAQEIYGDELSTDWRAKYQLESKYYGYYYRPLKYYAQPSKAQYAEVNNQTIPMIRMSEVYYIAAEAIFDSNPSEAIEYLKEVKKGRGVSFNKTGIGKEEFMNILVNDARREFLGEGQILYLYKRLNIPIKTGDPYYGEDVLPTDEYAVLPMPDSESSIN